MKHLLALFSQLRRLFVAPKGRDRPTVSAESDARLLDGEQGRNNRQMMVQIGWTLSFLLFLASFAQDGNHLQLFERLLNTCSLADTFLAILLHDRWSAEGLSRWDEAILFATISMGLRLFA